VNNLTPIIAPVLPLSGGDRTPVTPFSFCAGCAAALALLLVVCAGIPTALVWVLADPAHVPGGQTIGPEVGMRGLGLGPVAPFDHAGGPGGVIEEYLADDIRGGHADVRMKREVEFVAWGPHDLKGETVNVRKDDHYAVFRVRYRYQQEGQPLVERDQLFTLKPDEIREYAAAVKAERKAADWDGWSHILPPLPLGGCENRDGGAWLEKTLAKKRARESR
jgi:hypothetical protein